MLSRIHSIAVVTVLMGCNLILPPIPDVVPGAGDMDTGSGLADVSPWVDHVTGPDQSRRPEMPWPLDTHPATDVPPDQVSPDGGETIAPPPWECQTPMDLLAAGVETSSFTRFGQQAEDNFIYIYYSLCGVDFSISGPELGWFLQVDQVASLDVMVECQGPCWTYLMKDGCYYQNTEACWSPHDTPSLHWDVMPGIWYVAVEQMEEEGVPAPPEWVGPPFDIHVALNRTHAYPGCQEDGDLHLSDVLAEGNCEERGGETWRVWTRLGVLPAPGQGTDRAWIPCLAGVAPLDPIGGMPEYILRLNADQPGLSAARVDVEVTLDPSVQDALPSWAGILGVAGPPCGETAALVDCDGGLKKKLRVSEVTLLVGQEAFVYLDGVGAEALDGPKERAYRLDVRVAADCMP